jgi:hypothetical protein
VADSNQQRNRRGALPFCRRRLAKRLIGEFAEGSGAA